MFEKITKNVISRKLQRFEQSHLEARLATPWSTLTIPNYRVGTSKFEKKITLNFLKIFEKITKTSYLENYKDLRSHNWRQNTKYAILNKTLTVPNYRVGNFKFFK